MVIDDSNTIRRSAEIFLVQAGCKVILAEDGFDALAKITDHQPDIIFVDIMMPRLDGYQTCALIKKNTHFATTRSEEHTSELQSHSDLVCRLLLEKKKESKSLTRRRAQTALWNLLHGMLRGMARVHRSLCD